MHTLKTTTIVSAALFTLLLSACGGSGSPMNNNGGGGGGSVDTTTAQKIGAGSGSDFKNGQIGVTNDITSLSAGGSTTLEVYVVSSTNTPVITATTVNFISSCIAANKAVLKNSAGTVASSTPTINGRATMTYTANGCVGTDRVTASATINGATAYANVDLSIEAGTVGSIQFTSATPAKISLKGSGGTEASLVKFRVLDGNSAPVGKTNVTFSMSTTAGGLSLTPATATSDSDGYVSTTINAGTVATIVSVTATIEGTNITTSSGNLTVSTGTPFQRNASLAFSVFNPRGLDRNGEESTITMSMADDFGNPVPDGTAVTFWSEGGLIGDNCRTTNGRCSVIWRSEDFRPHDGRVTILAFASGNESFTDTNSNGRYDQGEPFEDLAEAYLNINDLDGFEYENGSTYDVGEKFVDLADVANQNQPNGNYDMGNGVYNGTLCSSDDPAVCSKEKVTVRKSWVLSMSGPYGYFELFSDRDCLNPSNGTISSTSKVAYVLASDINGNSLPSETVVGVGDPKQSQVFTVVPNTPDPLCYAVNVPSTGSYNIFSKTKEGEITEKTFSVRVN